MLELERDQAIYKGTVGPTVSEQELGIRDLNSVTSLTVLLVNNDENVWTVTF